ncbi:MAG: ATP-binding cassette domain-containing protein, partial [Deltaproteobacteria bacterium]|nr:ATP-binding cassette domain-containing protein [Deltaproteobacteria bacterium]
TFNEEEARLTQRAWELLARFQLSHYADTPARQLPYGEQRRCEMARALISGPRLLLLDEPAAGMNQSESENLIHIIRELKDEFQLTIILIEHQMRVVQNLCQQVTVLDFGCTIAAGPPAEIQHHPAVLEAYLGRDSSLGEEKPDTGATAPGLINSGGKREKGGKVKRERPLASLPFSPRLKQTIHTPKNLNNPPLLDVEDLWVSYDRINAVRGVSFTVGAGEIVTLIGANGAGKSTILRAVSGLSPVARGRVSFAGEDLLRLPAHLRLKQGVALVPEGRGIFGNLTVLENLRLAAYVRRDDDIQRDLEEVFTLFPRLKERRRQWGNTLSGGEQQMLAVGRALMSRAKLLLLDEPSMGLAPLFSMGLAPLLVREIFQVIRRINRQGAAILLVEQNANLALEIAHRAYILETGEIALSGAASELRHHPQVLEAYLGGT